MIVAVKLLDEAPSSVTFLGRPGIGRVLRPARRSQDYRADFVLVAELKEFMQARGRCRFVGYLPGKSALLRPQGGFGTAIQRAQPAGLTRPAASLVVPGPFTAPAVPAVGGLGIAAPRTTGGMDQ